MKLLDYIKQYEKSLNDFAKRIDVPQPTIWRIANEKVKSASGKIAPKIIKGCDGHVSYDDLFIQ